MKNPVKSGMIVKFSDSNRLWVVLEVTKKDLKRGINAEAPGLYAFGGLWYGSNPHKIKNYGKITTLEGTFEVVREDLRYLKVSKIKELVD